MAIGETIQAIRERRGLSRQELAKLLEMREEFLEAIELERVPTIHPKTIQRIADVLNVAERVLYEPISEEELLPEDLSLLEKAIIWPILISLSLITWAGLVWAICKLFT